MRPVEAELFHAHGRTAMTKPTIAFRNFSNAPKNQYIIAQFYHQGKGAGWQFRGFSRAQNASS